LPPASPEGYWDQDALSAALERLAREGFRDPAFEAKSVHSLKYLKLPHVHRTSKKLSEGRKKFYFRRRGMAGSLPGTPGSPAFMRKLIEKERERAELSEMRSQHDSICTSASLDVRTAEVPALREDRFDQSGEGYSAVFTLVESAHKLRRRPRWLREFLKEHPIGLDGKALFLAAGRELLLTEGDLGRILALLRHLTSEKLRKTRAFPTQMK
jgi:hypothetical protein